MSRGLWLRVKQVFWPSCSRVLRRDGASRPGCFEFSMDAVVLLVITSNRVERRTDAPAQCLTSDALKLQQALLCAATPGSGDCP